MPTLFQKIFKTGLVTEPLAPGDDEVYDIVRAIDARAKRLFGRALAIREVDAGSCNGCEIEITGQIARGDAPRLAELLRADYRAELMLMVANDRRADQDCFEIHYLFVNDRANW